MNTCRKDSTKEEECSKLMRRNFTYDSTLRLGPEKTKANKKKVCQKYFEKENMYCMNYLWLFI